MPVLPARRAPGPGRQSCGACRRPGRGARGRAASGRREGGSRLVPSGRHAHRRFHRRPGASGLASVDAGPGGEPRGRRAPGAEEGGSREGSGCMPGPGHQALDRRQGLRAQDPPAGHGHRLHVPGSGVAGGQDRLPAGLRGGPGPSPPRFPHGFQAVDPACLPRRLRPHPEMPGGGLHRGGPAGVLPETARSAGGAPACLGSLGPGPDEARRGTAGRADRLEASRGAGEPDRGLPGDGRAGSGHVPCGDEGLDPARQPAGGRGAPDAEAARRKRALVPGGARRRAGLGSSLDARHGGSSPGAPRRGRGRRQGPPGGLPRLLPRGPGLLPAGGPRPVHPDSAPGHAAGSGRCDLLQRPAPQGRFRRTCGRVAGAPGSPGGAEPVRT